MFCDLNFYSSTHSCSIVFADDCVNMVFVWGFVAVFSIGFDSVSCSATDKNYTRVRGVRQIQEPLFQVIVVTRENRPKQRRRSWLNSRPRGLANRDLEDARCEPKPRHVLAIRSAISGPCSLSNSHSSSIHARGRYDKM